jgi:LL-diaminopimelate aminotransferase
MLSPLLHFPDGAKCDIMRLQQMFGPQVVTAVQDPSYPVYVDTSVMVGQTKGDDDSIHPTTTNNQYDTIVYMPCTPANDFFPDYAQFPRADIVYICSPNNPTGAVATYDQLVQLVQTCIERKSLLVFDAAYAPFIRTPGTPKSIFEIPGANQVAIEVNSFSKYAGFTGVRLGWMVCPKTVLFDDGTPVWTDLNRVMSTTFNGPSNIVQEGGMACLDEQGLAEINTLIDYYLENAKLLKSTCTEQLGWTVYGGTDAPYIFVALPDSIAIGGSSWNAFQTILETCQVVTIPGAGFGPGGEGYVRLSAFAPRPAVLEACQRLTAAFGKSNPQ